MTTISSAVVVRYDVAYSMEGKEDAESLVTMPLLPSRIVLLSNELVTLLVFGSRSRRGYMKTMHNLIMNFITEKPKVTICRSWQGSRGHFKGNHGRIWRIRCMP